MPTRSNKVLIWKLGLAGFISASDNWVISPVLAAIASEFNVSISQAGIILTAYLLPYGLLQPVYGFLSDCWEKVKLLRLIVLGLACSSLGCFASQSLWTLCFWRLTAGVFAAGIIAVSLALIGDNVPVSERQNCVGIFIGIVFLGQGLSAGFGGLFAKYISWRILFAILAVAALCTIFFLTKIPAKLSCAKHPDFFLQTGQVILSVQGKFIFPCAFYTGFLLLGLYSYLGSFLHEIVKLDYLQVGSVIMLFGFSCFVAGRQIGKLAQKIGQKRTLIIGCYLALLTALLLMMCSYWPIGCLATLSLGFAYIFMQSTLATIAFDISSTSKGLPSALIGLGLFGGGALGTMFAGWVLANSCYSILYLTFSVGISLLLLYVKLYFRNGIFI